MQDVRWERWRSSFRLKVVVGLGLTGLADQLLFGHRLGAGLGMFALTWLALAVALRPATWRDRRALAATGAAVVYALLMAERFTLVGWSLFWTALTVAALSPRAGVSPGVEAWGRRVLVHALLSVTGPIRDLASIRRLQSRSGGARLRAILPAAILSLGGGAIFLGLFAMANPLIASVLANLRLPRIDFIPRLEFWLMAFAGVWAAVRPPWRPASLRPFGGRAGEARRRARDPGLLEAFGTPTSSVATALILFNALFAIENGLDLAILWSGAGLPDGMTLAQYAHRGAYPLIFTALLAGAFSLLVLRQGSATADKPLIRGLVGLWVGQNVLLSASSILRTLDYVQAYSLTRFRLAALLWMGLVMSGLTLIGWRILRRKSGAWLLGANALALAAVLSLACVADLGSVAAWWNVRHAREVGGTGAELDVCYLETLGPSALLPLLALEQQPLAPVLRARAAFVRRQTYDWLAKGRSDWRGWTWRDARRLAAADAIISRLDRAPQPMVEGCAGEFPPPRPAPSAPPPTSSALTAGAQP